MTVRCHLERMPATVLAALHATMLLVVSPVFAVEPAQSSAWKLDAVHLKSGKTEINYDKSENQVCTNSIFPHLGYDPCWYVRRHTRKMIDI